MIGYNFLSDLNGIKILIIENFKSLEKYSSCLRKNRVCIGVKGDETEAEVNHFVLKTGA